jgi:hypothetical protein
LRTSEKFDVNQAKSWLCEAEKKFPYEKTVVNLKEKLHNLVDALNENDKDELTRWDTFLTKAIVFF